MGFKPIDHRLGAVMFSILFLLGVVLCFASVQEYQMAFIGSLIWVFGKFSAAKNEDDKRQRKFDYAMYMDAEWDNLAVNLSGIFIVVPQMHNIAGLQDEVEYSDLWYYGAGILTDGIYILIIIAANMKKKYVGQSKENQGA